MFLRFPYFQGTITGSMSGLVCFLINKPINMYEDHMNLNTFLLEKTKWFYTDSNANPYSNPRSIFQKLNLKEFSRYFDWYISKLNNLYDFVQSINGLEKRHLLGFTIARICLDTYLIQIIEQPYLRKMIFFTLLDKYENLIKEFGSRKGDTIIWRELLSLTFFEENLKDLAKKTPRVLQILQGVRFNLKHTTRHVLHSKYDVRVNVKTHENEAIDFLRAYRNSHHGYFLTRNRSQRFLEHTGEIPNYLPDYALDLWHIFLADPQEFVNKLK